VTHQQPESEPVGRKFDGEKIPVGKGVVQYFPRALMAVGKVSAHGATKYAWFNWQYLEDARQRYEDAGLRHILGEQMEGLHDVDSGLLHQAHVVWCELAKLELMLRDGTPLTREG
jgi:hypothetical protein